MNSGLDHLFYMDDSGDPSSGLVVFGWVEFRPDRWASALGGWLELRKRLARDFGVAVQTELHATEYVNGRGRISRSVPEKHLHDGIAYWKDFGRDLANECLEALRCSEGLSVGAVWKRGDPSQIAQLKRDTYRALIGSLEVKLRSENSLGLIFMDGDGTDTLYRAAHRSLPLKQRHVIEDAVHLDSRHSQLVQMADLVAWSANAHIDRHAGNEFAWDWYERYLSERDPLRLPQML